MAAPTYDPERTKEDLNHLTGIDADEERHIEAAAHSGHLKDMEKNAADGGGQNGTPENLADAENASGGQSGSGGFTGGKGVMGGGDMAQQATKAIAGQAMQKIKGFVTPKRAVVGGGIISFLVILALMSSGFSAFELVNLRENALGHGNRYTNRVLQKRRAMSLGNMLNNMHDEKVPAADREKVKTAFEKQGFKVNFDADGKLQEFSYKSKSGETRKLDLASDDSVKASNDFFGDKKFGLESSRAFDKVAGSVGGLFRGPGARRVYKDRGFKFFNWLDRKASNKAKDPTDKFAEDLRVANTVEQEAAKADSIKNKQQLGDGQTDKNGKTTSAVDTGEVMDGALNGGMTPAEYQAQLLAKPTAGDEILGVKTADVESLADDTGKGITAGGIKEAALNSLGNGAFFKGSVAALAKSFNIVGDLQEACQVKGILSFVSNVRNIMLSVELARFSLRMLNAADDQKAGILSSEGLNIAMIAMNYPNPKNGKGHTAAGGEQFMFGDTKARPSKMNSSLFGTGRNNDGILGQINGYVNSIPGMDHCNVVNNGLVTAGGLVVGIVAAFTSGGTITGAQAASMVTLIAVHELVTQLAAPLLIKTAAHLVINGQEKNGEMLGDAFASGSGALFGMIGGSSGMRPSTNKQIAALDPEVQAYEHAEIADQSLYTRYLSPSNGNSLASHVALAIPSSFRGAAVSFTGGLASILHGFTSFSMLSNFIPGSNNQALALDSGCTDPQAKALNIATDPFCNPVMANTPALPIKATKAILLANQQIDDSGVPTDVKAGGDSNKSFAEYVSLCMSGRPGVLYNPSPDQSGNGTFTDDTCTESGPPLPGDTVGRYDRFAAWFGNQNDETNIKEQLGLITVQEDQQEVVTKTIN